MLKYALNNCENKAASPQKAPHPKTSVDGVRRVAKFFKRQPMLLTVNDPAMRATDGVEMLSVFLQAAEFPDSDLFYRVLHYAGVDVLAALKLRQATCQITASTACVLWLLASKEKESLLQAIFDMYDMSAHGKLSQEQATEMLQDLLCVGRSQPHYGCDVLVSELLSDMREYEHVLHECCTPSTVDSDSTADCVTEEAAATATSSAAESDGYHTPRDAAQAEAPLRREVFARYLVRKRPSLVASATSLQKQIHGWIEDVTDCSADECTRSEAEMAGEQGPSRVATQHLNAEVIELLEEAGYLRARRASNDRHIARRASGAMLLDANNSLPNTNGTCFNALKRFSSSVMSRLRRPQSPSRRLQHAAKE